MSEDKADPNIIARAVRDTYPTVPLRKLAQSLQAASLLLEADAILAGEVNLEQRRTDGSK